MLFFPESISRKFLSDHSSRLAMVLIALMALSCDDHPPDSTQPLWGDYYPTTEGSRWTYVDKYPCSSDGEILLCSDTLTMTAGGDPPFFQDDTYKPFSAPYGTFQWVKKVRGEYFTRGYYQPEYKFLDTSLGLNGTWSYESIFLKQTFVIIEVNGTRVVNGLRFTNVIGVLETTEVLNATGQFEEANRTYQYYARGIGKIYTLHPATQSNGEIENFLTDYFIKQ